MSTLKIHLCIVQPIGYIHSLGFLDQARFFRHQFRRLGAEVSLAKNRLRHDSINFIFGAHLGFEAEQRQRYSCIFVNLEQLGDGGASVSKDYLQLLSTSATVDYNPHNIPAYCTDPEDVPTFSLAHAPYLTPTAPLPLSERPIDLLFIGSLNERRRELIARIEACGREVTLFETPIYGLERDSFIAKAKAVLNFHFYPAARFEQARVFQCLSLGTPVISERTDAASIPVQFEDSMHWLSENDLEDFFKHHFDSPEFHDRSARQIEDFKHHDVINEYREMLGFASHFHWKHQEIIQAQTPGPWRPSMLHIGSGKDYLSGWLNVDILPEAQPDVVVDLAQALELPLIIDSPTTGPTELHADSLSLIYANNVLEHVADLPRLMTNCLALLASGGEMKIEVPYEHAPSAWQDPTHVRAFNENSWIYYVDWFWYLGWFDYRFEIKESIYLNQQLSPCVREQAYFMRVSLIKRPTSIMERMTARTMQADFGKLDDDISNFNH